MCLCVALYMYAISLQQNGCDTYIIQARTQDFEKGGSEYRVAVRPRRGGGCWRGMDASVKNIIYINFSLIVDVYKCKKMRTVGSHLSEHNGTKGCSDK